MKSINNLKRNFLLFLTFCIYVTSSATSADADPAFGRWKSDKYSMFIHFGLYSHLGGVWEGEEIRDGYSEQIQSFAGIFSDWYAETAYQFDPVNFDADRIALLAKEAGMRSIVFTSKHHDGFCMYDTETTDYNSMDMLAEGRDFVREISDACKRHGLNFGLYFSLIDWNYPHAYPISSHNADFITDEHHDFSMAQVKELLTSYGPVSELWFDMGAPQPWQSRELYELVKSLQPDCMVSGRLGNDVYDFAVMADNKLPLTALHAPWQSAASMFPETWSYRSWQERGEVDVKVAEKLRTLIDVVSRGGNYLLNIGPAADGSIVPFEENVLRQIGIWLKKNGEAIYGTDASPFSEDFSWGNVTVRGNMMYLLLTGKFPEDGRIVLPVKDAGLVHAEGAFAEMKRGACVVHVDSAMYSDPMDVRVISLDFNRNLTGMLGNEVIDQTETLTSINALPEYSYSCFDYYSNYRSTVSYGWNVSVRKQTDFLDIVYTADEEGREIIIEIDGKQIPVTLKASETIPVDTRAVLSDYRSGRLRGGVFDGPSSWESLDRESLSPSSNQIRKSGLPFSNNVMTAEILMEEKGLYVIEVTAGNGVEVVVDGTTLTKHLNPYRTISKTDKILLDLAEGSHEIIVRSYNRFEKEIRCGLDSVDDPELLTMKVVLPSPLKKGVRNLKVYAADTGSEHTDCGLHNLRITL